MKSKLTLFFILVIVLGCTNSEPEQNALARVNDHYLYPEDLKGVIKPGTSPEDSLVIIQNQINRWATRLLLLEGAERNLGETTIEDFDRLINQYRTDLYTKAYIEALVARNIDTMVGIVEATSIYEANRESFKLNEELVKLRYLNISQSAVNLDEVTESFKSFDGDDQRFLDSISVQFQSFNLNDSIWVKLSQVIRKIPVINAQDKEQLLKKSNFLEIKDSLNLYLVHIEDVLLPDDYAPLEYVRPTVNQIVINKRKLDLIKRLEKDITTDAIKKNEFEVY